MPKRLREGLAGDLKLTLHGGAEHRVGGVVAD